MDGRLLVLGTLATLGAATALRSQGSAKKGPRAPFVLRARVRLRVQPGLRALYGQGLPADGTVGSVAPMAIGQTRTPFVDGPRGGLVFVDFGGKHPVGVSPEDLVVVQAGSPGVVRTGRGGEAWSELRRAPAAWPKEGERIQIEPGAAHFLERTEYTLPKMTGIVRGVESDFLQLLSEDLGDVPSETLAWNRGQGFEQEGIVEVHAPFVWRGEKGSRGVVRAGATSRPGQPIRRKARGWTLTWDPARPRTIACVSPGWSDSAIRYDDGRIAFDRPEKIPLYVVDAVRRMYRLSVIAYASTAASVPGSSASSPRRPRRSVG